MVGRVESRVADIEDFSNINPGINVPGIHFHVSPVDCDSSRKVFVTVAPL